MAHALQGSFHPIPTEEKSSFRASALPYCPILHIDAAARNAAGIKNKPSVGWKDQFYLEIGTTAHRLWQRVLTRAARDPKAPIKVKPYGGWICSHCKRELPTQFLPEPCDCDPYSDWDYVEVNILYEGLSGHVDYIEFYPDTRHWQVWDLKTAMSHAVDNPVNKLPVLKNVFQIEAYCALLPDLIPEITHINEYSLLYHTRESASKWYSYRIEWDEAREKRTWKRIKRWRDGFFYAQEYLAEKRHRPEILLDVINVRPCINLQSWEREMLPAFVYGDGTGSCPYLNLCTSCESSTLVRKVYSLLEERIQEHKNKP